MRNAIFIFLMAFIPSIYTTSCAQKPSKQTIEKPEVFSDSCFVATVPDSIATILLEATKIKCEIVPSPNDTIKKETICMASKDTESVIKFIFYDKYNFTSDIPTRGMYSNWATISFITKKNKVAHIQLDPSFTII